MPSVCTGVAETTPHWNIVAGTPPLAQKKQSGLMKTLQKETLEVVGSILGNSFLYHTGKIDP